MHKINICLDSKIWIRNVPKIENKIRQILKKSIMTEKLFSKKKVEITVLLTRSNKMRFLNYKFRKINKDTDVLSFPCETPLFFEKKIIHEIIYLGDIALSFDYITKQNQNFNDYLKKILIHSFLHLIGHDHESKKSFLRMKRAQSKIINLL